MPRTVLSATPEQLTSLLNERYQKIQSLSAQVTFQLTEGGSLKGKEKTFSAFSGYILMRRPGDVRVIGFLPVIHTQAFDMASNGKTFTMVIPPKNQAFTGTNTVTEPAKNSIENLRPDIFFNSLLVQTITPDDLRVLTSETKTVVDPKGNRLLVDPLYDLTILHRKSPDSNVLVPNRMIQFDRTTLMPSEEDIYDAQGSIETQAIFGPPVNYVGIQFPSTIIIRRPLQQYQILVTFQKITFNLPLTNQEFRLKIPSGMPVKNLK